MKGPTKSQKPRTPHPTRPDPKIEEFHSAVSVAKSAFKRLVQATEAIHGPVDDSTLAGSARFGLAVALMRAAGVMGPFDSQKLTVDHGSEYHDAIADTMCDLAALARVSGLDEEDEFARRFIYYSEFKLPAPATK